MECSGPSCLILKSWCENDLSMHDKEQVAFGLLPWWIKPIIRRKVLRVPAWWVKWLSLITAFLLAMTSARRIGELQAQSGDSECWRFLLDGLGPSPQPGIPS